jgi:hypothetical protein
LANDVLLLVGQVSLLRHWILALFQDGSSRSQPTAEPRPCLPVEQFRKCASESRDFSTARPVGSEQVHRGTALHQRPESVPHKLPMFFRRIFDGPTLGRRLTR